MEAKKNNHRLKAERTIQKFQDSDGHRLVMTAFKWQKRNSNQRGDILVSCQRCRKSIDLILANRNNQVKAKKEILKCKEYGDWKVKHDKTPTAWNFKQIRRPRRAFWKTQVQGTEGNEEALADAWQMKTNEIQAYSDDSFVMSL